MPALRRDLRARFWVEAVLASITSVLIGVTLVSRDWIETFGIDPDHGDGSLEWVIVLGLLAVTLSLATVARFEWHRTVPAQS